MELQEEFPRSKEVTAHPDRVLVAITASDEIAL